MIVIFEKRVPLSPQIMDTIKKYFPATTDEQLVLLEQFHQHILQWNENINVISRKDTEEMMVKHILHSLAIAKLVSFTEGTKILDIGTGGGFPGIPLAILFPECEFHLIDSTGKKITVVNAFVKEYGLQNVVAEKIRAEEVENKYDFIVSRAVMAMPKFIPLAKGKIRKGQQNSLRNGIIALKGGDLTEELAEIKKTVQLFNISDWFSEPFFETKKIVYIKM